MSLFVHANNGVTARSDGVTPLSEICETAFFQNSNSPICGTFNPKVAGSIPARPTSIHAALGRTLRRNVRSTSRQAEHSPKASAVCPPADQVRPVRARRCVGRGVGLMILFVFGPDQIDVSSYPEDVTLRTADGSWEGTRALVGSSGSRWWSPAPEGVEADPAAS